MFIKLERFVCLSFECVVFEVVGFLHWSIPDMRAVTFCHIFIAFFMIKLVKEFGMIQETRRYRTGSWEMGFLP